MEFYLHTCGSIAILYVPTRTLGTQIDAHRLSIAATAAAEVTCAPARLILDLKRVESISHLGAMPLLVLRKQLQDDGGRMVVVHASEGVRRYFRKSRLERVIPLVDTLDDAFVLVSEDDCDDVPSRQGYL